MNPNLSRLALRPRSPFEVFDLCLALLRSAPWPALKLVAIIALLPALLISPFCWYFEGHWAFFLLFLPVLPLLQAPATFLGARLLFSPDASAFGALKESFLSPKAVFLACLTSVAPSVILAVTCLALLLPLVAGTAFSWEALLLERVTVGRALRRSSRLAMGAPGGALSAGIAQVGLSLWGYIIGEATGQFVLGTMLQLGSPFGSALDGQVTPFALAGLLCAQPLISLYRLLLYVDARTRSEGWDLQVGLRAAGLAAGASA